MHRCRNARAQSNLSVLRGRYGKILTGTMSPVICKGTIRNNWFLSDRPRRWPLKIYSEWKETSLKWGRWILAGFSWVNKIRLCLLVIEWFSWLWKVFWRRRKKVWNSRPSQSTSANSYNWGDNPSRTILLFYKKSERAHTEQYTGPRVSTAKTSGPSKK